MRLPSFVSQRPLTSVALAFGAGYVLGGGLFARATARLIALTARLGGLVLLRRLAAEGSSPVPESVGAPSSAV